MKSINLYDRTSGGKIRNLSGKEAGELARKQFGLDQLDKDDEPVQVLFPESVYSIGPSFFCGLFGESYSHLGPNRLLEHYQFNDVPDFILAQIQHGVELCQSEYS